MGLITKHFDKNTAHLLKQIGDLAESMGYRAFLVGGTVRDLILGVENLDLDIAIEGDAIKLGEKLSKELRAGLVVHKMFGTCTLAVNSKLKIDLATARKEVYEKPAALPIVKFSSLKDDLARRDFTINAMAMSINKDDPGRLIDPFDGRRALAKGVIKVLHNTSFIDDPTRIFRAVRFEARPGFLIDPKTLRLMKAAINKGMLSKLSKYRVKKEIVLILKEDGRHKALERLEKLGAGIIRPGKL